jgi:DNA-binding NarL/FixJ family response regulator
MAIQRQALLAAPATLQQPLHPCLDHNCTVCRRNALRLRQLERANDELRRDAECVARRLQAAIAQLAAAQRQNRAATPSVALSLCPGEAVQQLATRERQVLSLIAEGQRTPSIAARLGISAATVEVHRRNIMRKLGLHSVAQLTRYAVREGIASL